MPQHTYDDSIKSAVEKSIILLHKGEVDITDEMETFNEIDLTGRKDLEEALQRLYSVDALPCILAYGQVFSIEEIEAVKQKEREFNESEYNAAIDMIKRNKRVIFIKGTPNMPQCKFTRELINMLKEEGLVAESDYKSVNVLDSVTVREKIKEYGDWPTYPQVYINQELVGGLDVLKVERKNGTIRSILDIE
ncbi:monothiol glutaredoxin [Nematocida parisii]|nr:monothiol glutaredoxin [Nematocida parisii]KAI5155011.1 monothiol glutaredoxin [Nematocida parisii]KAI5156968.1 monothiol glutaredoxin [Nematocida parisii]